MPIEVVFVDAFARRPGTGNPAAVCLLPTRRPEEWYQPVAAELAKPATAFLLEQAEGYSLRWFSPTAELALCGHGTLASAHTLWEMGRLPHTRSATFFTRSGQLTASREDDWIWLDFPSQPAAPIATPVGLETALGADVRFVGQSRLDYLVELESEAVVRQLRPDLAALAALPIRGVIVTSRADKGTEGAEPGGYDFVSRFFAPSVGLPEDAVTGSAHCTLGPYWSGRLNKMELAGLQVSARGGEVRVRIEDNRVRLGGQAVSVLRGELAASIVP